ncbi:MAG: IS1595 family transposase [Oscillospiraceae bacterium]|nr:IS1595 family transposase [Oscillospiraceae bacterium]
MKKEMNVESLLEVVKGLSRAEQSTLAEQIMRMMAAPSVPAEEKKSRRNLCKDMGIPKSDERPDCPHCAAKASLGYIIKRGLNKGAQRYYCKSCGKYFVPTTNTAFAFTRKNADTWKKFIQMTISGESLKSCEEACRISHLTAFTWRHKILNVFAQDQEQLQMSGNVEVDEMLIPISYKGNHIQGAFGKREKRPGAVNNMPRKSYHRGTDNKYRSSKEKACVFCMVENGNKSFFATVPGVGFMNESMLNGTVAKHINKDKALLLADDYNATKAYFEKNGYRHIILLSNTSDNPRDHKPEVRDGLHLQHVNAMHHHIRNFLKPYYGVSTKYLSNYIALFIWLKSVGQMKKRKKVEQISLTRAAAPDCYITGKKLLSRPAVPQCA